MDKKLFENRLIELIDIYNDKRPFSVLHKYFWSKWEHISDKTIDETLELVYTSIQPKYGKGIPEDDISHILGNIIKREKNKYKSKEFDNKHEKAPFSLKNMLSLCWMVARDKKEINDNIKFPDHYEYKNSEKIEHEKIILYYVPKFIKIWEGSTDKGHKVKSVFVKMIENIDKEIAGKVNNGITIQ